MIFKNEYLAIHFISLQKIYNTMTGISLARFQVNRRPSGFVRRIGKMLCFQANRSPLVINDPFFPFHSSIQEVAGIHLNTGLIRIYFEYYTGLRRRQTGSDSRKISFSVQYKIMVVTVSIFQLNKIILPSDFFRLSEVHGVPATGTISPVVIKVLSTGVYPSAFTYNK